MDKFKIGDRVRAIIGYDGNRHIIGKLGTVVRISPYMIGVKFDKYVEGHDLCGTVDNGYGWWCPPSVLIRTQ